MFPRWAALGAAVFLFSACDPSTECPRADRAVAERVPRAERVFLVVLENTDASDALAQPFLGELARRGAYLRDFRALTHPSQPNYIGLVAGDRLGVNDNDSNLRLDGPHLGDLLERGGKDWKVYAEGYPGNGCFLGESNGAYVRRHVPFLAFRNVQNDPSRCARVVPAARLAEDAAAGAVPELSLYIPDNNGNGHDTGVAHADAWARATLGPLLDDPGFMDGTLFIVTFDEAARDPANRVYTVLLGDTVSPGASQDSCQDHYGLLRTVEESLGLGTLGRQDERAAPITGIWKG